LNQRPIPLFGAALLLLTILAFPLAAPAADDDAAQFHALLADQWEWQLREFPEGATAIGDNRYNDRLSDLSAAAVARRKLAQAEFLARLNRIDPAKLSGQDGISYAVFLTQRRMEARLNAFYGELPFGSGAFGGADWTPVSQMAGPHTSLPALVKQTPFNTVRDYENYLKRLGAVSGRIDQIIERMQAGIKSGWMPPAAPLARVPQQIDAQIVPEPTRSLLYQPFTRFPADIPDAERQRLAAAGRKVIAESVVPAFARLKSYFVEKYLPVARKDLDASRLPGGPDYYQAVIAQQTTTSMTAQDIHRIGLEEVRRIDAEMEKVVRDAGFKGTRAEFIDFINNDPQFLFTRSEDMLEHYRALAKRADAALPPLFATLPRLPYGVRAMEAYEGDNAEHYTRGSGDGSRAGFFEANVLNLKRRSKPTMDSTLLHEAVPGHHLQIARQQELDLPPFRRFGGFGAYVEGWALYAESLGTDMGFYKDPYTNFGRLSSEMFRACRLVIDTGLHSMKWTREQAIDYLASNAGVSRALATAEVDRYIVWPGQALSYKMGELKIKSLRAKAKDALGDRFDIRRFNNAVIDNGALPLDVLEQQIDLWIAGEKQRGA
jgi:uncharacterized protein (DUF885 family)